MQPTILVKAGKGEPWRAPEARPYTNEEHLRTLLQGAPELLPGVESSRPAVLVHELEVRYGYIDLVGVSPTGAITVVECKLRGNPDMRRTVVGQLFAYAAGLWGMTYAEFDEAWQGVRQPFTVLADQWEARRRPPLLEDMARAVEEHGLEWDRDGFAAAVEANLAAGRYTLVFAVDEITPELQRIVEYLSEHTSPEVNVIALRIGYMADGDTEVLVPQPFGVEMAARKVAASPAPGGPPVAPDEASFMRVLGEAAGDWAPAVVAEALAWADREGLLVWYGSGRKVGTANVGLLDATGARRPLIAWWTSGTVEVEFSQLAGLPPFDAPGARVEVLRRLEAVEGKTRPDRQANSWVTVDAARLREPGALAEFLAIFADVAGRIRG